MAGNHRPTGRVLCPERLFIEDQSAASCEDGSEVSHRRELSAVDLPVRSMWAGHVSCDVDSAGRCHTAGCFGCGACWDCRCSTADGGRLRPEPHDPRPGPSEPAQPTRPGTSTPGTAPGPRRESFTCAARLHAPQDFTIDRHSRLPPQVPPVTLIECRSPL